MTLDRLPLLDATDAAADLLRTADPDSPADDELISRRSQKERLPGLDREQFQTLYAEWQDRYAAKAAQDRKRGVANIKRISDEYARANVPADSFVCPCGAVLNDPLDPAVMAIHQPHYLAAKQAGREGRAGESDTSC
jgi:hypothetical protein